MATYIKISLDSTKSLYADTNPIQIETKLNVNGRYLTILNFHPLSPGNLDYVKRRDKQRAAIPAYASKQFNLTIIAGDFNITP